ncbi:transposase, partial [Staphylococcus epidermidis]
MEKEELQAKLRWYEEQFRLSQQRRFGASSEKTTPDQISLFNEAEVTADPAVEEPTIETVTYKRKKQRGQRERMLEN